jgi:hypothetical protein
MATKGQNTSTPSLTSCSSRARSPARSGRYEGPRFSSFGSPTDVVELAEIEPDDPGRGQLAVAIEAAPINPSDLMLIKGIYRVRNCPRRSAPKESVASSPLATTSTHLV